MTELLQEFLETMEVLGKKHSGFYDTAVRECMGEAIYVGFVMKREGYKVPNHLGLFSDEANAEVQGTLQSFLDQALAQLEGLGETDEDTRKKMIWRRDIATESGITPDGFLGAF